MTVTVVADLYSGRPNPSFQLTPSQEEKLRERLSGTKEHIERRPSGVFGGLGYRGFKLSRPPDHPAGPLHLHLHEGIADQGAFGANFVDDTRIEHWLAEIAARHLSESASHHIHHALSLAPEIPHFNLKGHPRVGCPAVHAADAPPYAPGAWNIPAVQPYNNCYNYANNQQTNTFAQPGRGSGHPFLSLDCGGVEAAAIFDGLVASVGFQNPLGPGQGWYVALVIWPGNDYHWYRQDSSGCWSHKPGQTAVRDTDNAGHQIADPQTCDRGPYVDFCTYMITHKGVHIA